MAVSDQITASVHSMDANSNICIITIRDGNELVVDNSNIGLETNQDGSSNTAWLRDRISSYVAGHRAAKARKDNAVIYIDIGEPIV